MLCKVLTAHAQQLGVGLELGYSMIKEDDCSRYEPICDVMSQLSQSPDSAYGHDFASDFTARIVISIS